jgi:hypothetical protein
MSVIYETLSAVQFYNRVGACYLYFNNLHWIIGGQIGATSYNDVWNSPDGMNWTRVQDNAAFSARQFLAGCVFDGAMWIMGGRAAGNNFHDVWTSTDGITWTQVSSNPTFPAMHAMNVLVFNSAMWVLGGMRSPDVAARSAAIYSSTDGITWTSHGNGAYGAREYSALFVIGSYAYLVSGAQDGGGYMSDVWRSTDCITWSQISTGQFTARYGQRGAFYNNKMWVVCGTNAAALNNIYSSPDGITWTLLGITVAYIYYHCSFTIGDSIFLIGGVGNGISKINMNYDAPAPVEKSGGYFL